MDLSAGDHIPGKNSLLLLIVLILHVSPMLKQFLVVLHYLKPFQVFFQTLKLEKFSEN